MEGFILQITKSIREDLIVKILSKGHFYTLYRFYGARHSIIHTGRKIDFEIEYQGVYMPKLRHLMHLSREYEKDIEKVFVWQRFCMLLSRHLSETKELSNFYFDLLDDNSKVLNKQNAKRTIIQMYIQMLEFEGRLYSSDVCFMCGERLGENVALGQGFILACPKCIIDPLIINKAKILELFKIKTLINITDIESAKIYDLILHGL